MKKTLSILLAIVMMFALSVSVLADTETVVSGDSAEGETSANVTATYKPGEKDTDTEGVATVYLVTVDWQITSNLSYYDGTTTYTWNADETKYVEQDPTDQAWDGQATVEITVTNKSNAAITASAEWTNGANITEANCKFDSAEIEVPSAAEGVNLAEGELVGEEQTDTIEATIDSESIEGSISADDDVVGTITVTIAAAE